MKKNIVLVGFMGTGKSTVGRLLAQQTQMELVDMDALIEERAEKTIPAIFEQDGEPAFRSMEHDLAKELAGRAGLVIAAGGGIVLNSENVANLAATGIVVCLQASADTILQRVAADAHRPLLEDGEKAERIRSLLQQRRERYAAIPYQVDTESSTPEAVAERILAIYEQATGDA